MASRKRPAGASSSPVRASRRQQQARGPPRLDVTAEDDEPGGYNNPLPGNPLPGPAAREPVAFRGGVDSKAGGKAKAGSTAKADSKAKTKVSSKAKAEVGKLLTGILQCARTQRQLTSPQVRADLLGPDSALRKVLADDGRMAFRPKESLQASALTDIITASRQTGREKIISFLINPMGFCPSAPLPKKSCKAPPLIAAILERSLTKPTKVRALRPLIQARRGPMYLI